MPKPTTLLLALFLTASQALAATPNTGEIPMSDRYARGWAALTALAPHRAQAVQDGLADIAPDLGRFIVEFGYGDIFTRPGLTPDLRQTATIAALTALGNAAPQLAFHIEAGLAAGLSPQAVIDIIYVTTVFAGFPAAINAIAVARQVFAEKHLQPTPTAPPTTDRRTRGLASLNTTSQTAGQHVVDNLADVAPDLADFIIDFSYGDVISRNVLTPAQKELAMIAAATARGTMAPQLAVHIKAARQVGVTRVQIVETILQMAAYAGFPAAINAMTVAREALAEAK